MSIGGDTAPDHFLISSPISLISRLVIISSWIRKEFISQLFLAPTLTRVICVSLSGDAFLNYQQQWYFVLRVSAHRRKFAFNCRLPICDSLAKFSNQHRKTDVNWRRDRLTLLFVFNCTRRLGLKPAWNQFLILSYSSAIFVLQDNKSFRQYFGTGKLLFLSKYQIEINNTLWSGSDSNKLEQVKKQANLI